MNLLKNNFIVDGIKFVLTPIIEHFQHKRELKQLERETELAMKAEKLNSVLRREESAQEARQNYDIEAIKNSGWKDEYLVIILSIPLIGCFVPFLADDILAGFKILEQTPEWYRLAVGVMITAVFGRSAYYNFLEKSIERKHKIKAKTKEESEDGEQKVS